MKESIFKYFDVGLVQWMSFPKSDLLDSLTQIARDDFFSAIEIKGFGSEERNAAAKKILEQSHLRVAFSASPWLMGKKLNPNALNEEDRLAAENELKAALDEAESFGAKGISMLAGKWEMKTREEAYQQLLKTLRNVCSYAAEKQMQVELEVFDYDMDKAALIGPAPFAARLGADMRMTHSNFGLLVDLSHFPTTYENSRFVIQMLRPFITHFHIGNAVVKKGCDAYGDMHPRFGYPNSANDVQELLDFLRVIKNEGFFRPEERPILSVEVTLRPGEDEQIVLANTKRCVSQAWAMLED